MAELFQIFTQVILHPLAKKAFPTNGGGFYNYSIPFLKTIHFLSFLHDDSRELMSKDQRETDQGMLSFIGLDIRTADGGSLDLNEELVGPGRRHRDLFNRYLKWFFTDGCLHFFIRDM
jgi:hypothetical protein